MWWIKFYVFVYLVHTSGNKVGVYRFGIIHNQSIIYIAYVERYVFGVGKMLYMFILKELQEYFGNCARDR
jgi:hypothetical protein